MSKKKEYKYKPSMTSYSEMGKTTRVKPIQPMKLKKKIYKGDNAKGDPWFNVKVPPVNVKGGKRSKEEVARIIARRKNPKDRMTIEYRNGKKVYVVAPKKKK